MGRGGVEGEVGETGEEGGGVVREGGMGGGGQRGALITGSEGRRDVRGYLVVPKSRRLACRTPCLTRHTACGNYLPVSVH